MKAVAAFLLVLCHLAITHGNGGQMNQGIIGPTGPFSPYRPRIWTCSEAPRLYDAHQIDAGNGKVVARDRNGYSYFLIGSNWFRMSYLRFNHVTVGPAGLWGCDRRNIVHKYVAGNFVRSSGRSMLQVDAGGDGQVVGVSTGYSGAYCLRSNSALAQIGGSLSWVSLRTRMRYYSCSPKKGCWGVDTSYRVYYTRSITPETCSTSGWTQVEKPRGQNLKMIKVGSDGNVIGVTTSGQVFQRVGIAIHPRGLSWFPIPMCMPIRHVSYDLINLWVVSNSGFLLKCR